MEKFTVLQGIVAPLDRSNVDTDAIIPKQFLKSIYRTGYGPNLFDEWRYLDKGEPGMDPATRKINPDFVLNQPRYQGSTILLARKNFGCGSSREHAPWVLECNGINIVIAENFARIFRQNMFNCGLMAISLDRAAIDEIFKTFAGTDAELTTDIENRTFTISNGAVTKVYPFTVGEFDLELVKAGGWVNYADSKY